MTPQELRTHLKRLVWCGKLHRLLRSGELRLPWADLLFVLHFVFYVAAGIHIWRVARAARLAELSPQPGDIAWLITLVLCGVALRLGWRLARSPEERIKARLRTKGVLVPGAIVQVNSAYLDPAHHEPCPGSLLISFDPRAESELDRLGRAGERLRSLKRADRSRLPRAHADIAPRGTPKTGQLGTVQNRPVRRGEFGTLTSRGAFCSARRNEQRLEAGQAGRDSRAGPPGLVAASHRGSDGRSSGDGVALLGLGWDRRAAATWPYAG